jgi:hypothetical protein
MLEIVDGGAFPQELGLETTANWLSGRRSRMMR